MDAYVGEIRVFAGTYAPVGWALCDGSLLDISGNEMLYSLIGTTYGGNGQTNFALPDLRGRVPIHAGTNPQTGTSYTSGERAGVETVTLLSNQLPVHTHTVNATATPGASPTPINNVSAAASIYNYGDSTLAPVVPMNANTLSSVGSGQAHDNMMPSLAVTFIICTEGLYPDFP
ncbi:phage tail protein [Tumebacillus flagellatus]|uniref:Tail collar protein n=1 Tax=Tumebacillus flagellatus TaxID=1157490 RepID=A0A074LUX1_9BACL|nr:tail fiber protein [Tumebacillus flagellatus]KEO84734.1 tail collar protein [Tumebacillus flagellatus]